MEDYFTLHLNIQWCNDISIQLQQWGEFVEEETENFKEKFASGRVWRDWWIFIDSLQGQDVQGVGYWNLGCEVSILIRWL